MTRIDVEAELPEFRLFNEDILRDKETAEDCEHFELQ